jgi:alpha-galactosidase/6-phospho-beta-glucosidase family protein
MYLVELAENYAISRNLDVREYITAMLNPDTIGDSDAYDVVEHLIKYHKEWAEKGK